MEGMEEKLGAILENPQLMQQIMQLAQSVNIPKPSQSREPPKKRRAAPKDFSPGYGYWRRFRPSHAC